MPTNTTYLITGANRGLGLGMAAEFLARPATTVVAALRDPKSSALDLKKLPVGQGSRLVIVKIDSASETDPTTALCGLQSDHQIRHLDCVIANAAIGKTYPEVSALTCVEISLEDMYEHFKVNTIGPLLLFRAALPLLKKSSEPKFVLMSSFAASITEMKDCPFPNAAYGPSKIGANYLSVKIHFEHEDLISFAISPGWVRTAMGNAGAQMFGMKEAALTIEESVAGLIQVIDEATREHTSGKFMEYTGRELGW